MGRAATIAGFDADGVCRVFMTAEAGANGAYWEKLPRTVDTVQGRFEIVAVDDDPKLPDGVDAVGAMADPTLLALDGDKIVKREEDHALDAAKLQAVGDLSNAFVAVVEAGIAYDGKSVRLDRDAAFYAAVLVYPGPWKGLPVDCVDGSRVTIEDPEAFARAALETCAQAEKLRALSTDVQLAEDASAVAAVLGR